MYAYGFAMLAFPVFILCCIPVPLQKWSIDAGFTCVVRHYQICGALVWGAIHIDAGLY
eukprot:COSAG05_NODE_903_length_6662_cov_2.632333_3_plen_58_part_00